MSPRYTTAIVVVFCSLTVAAAWNAVHNAADRAVAHCEAQIAQEQSYRAFCLEKGQTFEAEADKALGLSFSQTTFDAIQASRDGGRDWVTTEVARTDYVIETWERRAQELRRNPFAVLLPSVLGH